MLRISDLDPLYFTHKLLANKFIKKIRLIIIIIIKVFRNVIEKYFRTKKKKETENCDEG